MHEGPAPWTGAGPFVVAEGYFSPAFSTRTDFT